MNLGARIARSARLHIQTDLSARKRFCALSALACILGLVVWVYAFVIPQTPARLERPAAALFNNLAMWRLVIDLPLPAPRASATVGLLILVTSGLAFLAYGVACLIAFQSPPRRHLQLAVAAMGLVLLSLGVWALPNVNTDIYNYIMRGRVAAEYGENPYYVAADNYPDDPLYPFASKQYTSRQGDKFPAWVYLNILLAQLAGDDPVTNLLIYRLAFFALSAGNLALLWLIVRRIDPARVTVAVVAYAWNPIVLLFSTSKTDTFMVFYFLLAVWLLASEWRRLAIVAMIASVLVKPLTLPLIAIYFGYALKLRRWRDLILDGATAALTAVVLYLPVARGAELMLRHSTAVSYAANDRSGLWRPILIGAFALLTLWAGLSHKGDIKTLANRWSIVMLFFCLFLAQIGFSWYLIVLIALVALASSPALLLATTLLSFPAFVFNAWEATFNSNYPAPTLCALSPLVVYLVPAIVIVVMILVMRFARVATFQR